MANEPKIVVIGAGSTNFCFVTLNDILREPRLQNATLCMVDIDENNLNLVSSLAKVIKNRYQSKIELYADINRRKVLEEADFVILSSFVDDNITLDLKHLENLCDSIDRSLMVRDR